MKILLASVLMLSISALADNLNISAKYNVLSTYRQNTTRELIGETKVTTGSARVSGRVRGESFDNTVDYPGTSETHQAIITVLEDGNVKIQNLKENVENTYRAKVKFNKDGTVKEIKIKGSAIKESSWELVRKPIEDLKAEVPDASVNLDVKDLVCKSSNDLVGVYHCNTEIRVNVSARF